MFGFHRRRKTVEGLTELTMHVSQEAMDAAFDRAPSRWCDHCKVSGSHHTERHNDFAAYALAYEDKPGKQGNAKMGKPARLGSRNIHEVVQSYFMVPQTGVASEDALRRRQLVEYTERSGYDVTDADVLELDQQGVLHWAIETSRSSSGLRWNPDYYHVVYVEDMPAVRCA